MEANPTFLPHDFAKYGDGEENYRRPNSRGNFVSGGSLKKNQWYLFTYIISNNI
jgi:hypothetical protein